MLKVVSSVGGGGGISGSGTTNYLPKFASSTSLGDSKLLQAGTTILTQRAVAPAYVTATGTTLSASALCGGYVRVDVSLFGSAPPGDFVLPTGTAIDTELGLSGSTPTNVTFDCTFCAAYPSSSGDYVLIYGNTGNVFYFGDFWQDSNPPNGAITIYDYPTSCNVTLRFYRTGAASYTIYPVAT